MDKSSIKTAFFLLLLIIISVQIPSSLEGSQHIDHKKEEKPSFTKMVQRAVLLLKHSHRSSWEKIKTAIYEIQFRYFPPNLDFRGSDEANPGNIKEAAGKSFKTSKETVEGSAKSAAEAVGKTVHKTVKKASDSVSGEESNAEL